MEVAPQQTADSSGPNLSIEKVAEGSITCFKFRGTIDEAFEGKKLGSTVRASTLILDMGQVKKISSFGLREWADFIRAVEKSAKVIYLIECTPKVVDQLNMVANFVGKGLVFSFYAPYRCDYCDVDRRVLFQVDRDRDAIKAMKPPERPCETCGNPEYFDEDPAGFFSCLAAQPDFDLEEDAASFLVSKLKYSLSDTPRRLQAEKYVEGRNTYLKIMGNLDGSFPREKLAEGLEGTICLDVSGIGSIDPAGAAEWRGFIAAASPTVDAIYLLGCPPMFLERVTRPEDLGDKVQVLSFAIPYSCASCATTTAQLVDVEEHFEILRFATPPEMKCHDCRSPMTCVATETLLSHLPTLPKPTAPAGLGKFIKEAQSRKREKLTRIQPKTSSGIRPAVLLGVISVPLVVAAVLVVLNYTQQRQAQALIQKALASVKTEQHPKTARPAWITSDVRSAGYCTDYINRVSCVGVSSYRDTKAQGRTEAANAAMDELANALALKIEAPMFVNHVRSAYTQARKHALSAFDDARTDPNTPRFKKTLQAVRNARLLVAHALKQSGGAAIPSQPADWHWEEYKKQPPRKGTEFLVFIRYDISADEMKALIDLYSKPAKIAGGEVLTYFPAMAWKYPDVTEGAIVVDPGKGMLKKLGLAANDIITAVRGNPVRSATQLAALLKKERTDLRQHGGKIQLTVKRGNKPPHTVAKAL